MSKSIPKICVVRLQKELKALSKEAPDFVTARPIDENLLIWHFLFYGPAQSPYAGGIYHGALTFPKEYPYKPPSIRMITPNGRFKPNAKICLSMSDFHPETWNPMWSVSTVLHGLLAFMLDSSPVRAPPPPAPPCARRPPPVARPLHAALAELSIAPAAGGGRDQDDDRTEA